MSGNNWIYLKETRQYLNMDMVVMVAKYDPVSTEPGHWNGDVEVVYPDGNSDIFRGQDASRILAYFINE